MNPKTCSDDGRAHSWRRLDDPMRSNCNWLCSKCGMAVVDRPQ